MDRASVGWIGRQLGGLLAVVERLGVEGLGLSEGGTTQVVQNTLAIKMAQAKARIRPCVRAPGFVQRLGVWGLGFRIQGLAFRVWGLRFRV